MTSSWRLAARAAIQRAIAQLPEDCDRSQIKKAIDAAYPFGFRALHPYKIWLDERRHYFYQLGIPTKKPYKRGRATKKPGVKHDLISPGQLSLFPDDYKN